MCVHNRRYVGIVATSSEKNAGNFVHNYYWEILFLKNDLCLTTGIFAYFNYYSAAIIWAINNEEQFHESFLFLLLLFTVHDCIYNIPDGQLKKCIGVEVFLGSPLII